MAEFQRSGFLVNCHLTEAAPSLGVDYEIDVMEADCFDLYNLFPSDTQAWNQNIEATHYQPLQSANTSSSISTPAVDHCLRYMTQSARSLCNHSLHEVTVLPTSVI